MSHHGFHPAIPTCIHTCCLHYSRLHPSTSAFLKEQVGKRLEHLARQLVFLEVDLDTVHDVRTSNSSSEDCELEQVGRGMLCSSRWRLGTHLPQNNTAEIFETLA